jgi:ABC-type dipeptide/oligopeptide/nickel transport system permease component
VLSKTCVAESGGFNLVADILYGIVDPRIRYD